MKKPKYFTLGEFVYSDTATAKNIDNTPSFEIVKNIYNLVVELLDPLREEWGSAIEVTSGYRCEELNKAVGGVFNSAHLRGDAADIYPMNCKIDEFIEFIKDWSKDKQFDQIIIEKRGNSRWIHIARQNSVGATRGQLFSIEK